MVSPHSTNLRRLFIQGAEACGCIVNKFVRVADPVGNHSDFRALFRSCMEAWERLIRRALIPRLVLAMTTLYYG